MQTNHFVNDDTYNGRIEYITMIMLTTVYSNSYKNRLVNSHSKVCTIQTVVLLHRGQVGPCMPCTFFNLLFY